MQIYTNANTNTNTNTNTNINANTNAKLQTQIKTPSHYNQAAHGAHPLMPQPASYIDFSTTSGPAEDECDINVKCHVCHRLS